MQLRTDKVSAIGLLIAIVLLYVTACGPPIAQSDTPVSSPQTASQEPIPTQSSDDNNIAQSNLVENETLASLPPLDTVSEDFGLVGKTGRPQFVFTYARW